MRVKRSQISTWKWNKRLEVETRHKVCTPAPYLRLLPTAVNQDTTLISFSYMRRGRRNTNRSSRNGTTRKRDCRNKKTYSSVPNWIKRQSSWHRKEIRMWLSMPRSMHKNKRWTLTATWLTILKTGRSALSNQILDGYNRGKEAWVGKTWMKFGIRVLRSSLRRQALASQPLLTSAQAFQVLNPTIAPVGPSRGKNPKIRKSEFRLSWKCKPPKTPPRKSQSRSRIRWQSTSQLTILMILKTTLICPSRQRAIVFKSSWTSHPSKGRANLV